MTALAAISAIQARIGAIESRIGVGRTRAVQTTGAGVFSDQTGAATSALPLGYADVAAGVDDQLAGASNSSVMGDYTSAVRPASIGAATQYDPFALGGVSSVAGPNSAGTDAVAPTVPYAASFNAAGARWGIPPTVLAGMAHVESRFRTDVVSQAGAVGMMQFLPATAASMGVNPLDPNSAIEGAARYLRNALDRFGSLDMAIGAYNIGPGAMAQAGAVLPGTQAERYVSAVRAAAGRMS